MSNCYERVDTFQRDLHLEFFGMRPTVQKGFKVTVQEGRSHVTPSILSPFHALDEEQKPFV